MDLGLHGRTAVVCGASSGMGLGIAESLRSEGANVVMFARREDLLRTEAERIGGLPLPGDVRDAKDLERLVDAAAEAYGGIDILVNNSGGPPRSTAADLDAESVRDAVELLLESVVTLTGLCLPYLERSGRGRVVNITSSTVREPIADLALSNVLRPGIIGWAKTLAKELGPKAITVNSIAPGSIDTERIRELHPDGPSQEDLNLIPLRRLGTPREIGDVVAFLCSEQASYVSGAVIFVDGAASSSL